MSINVYLNGEFLPVEEASVSVTDRGFLFGDGVYEVIPVYGGHLFQLQHHLQRLHNSLRGIGMANPHTEAEWEEILTRLSAQLGESDQALYLQVTRGCTDVRDHAWPENLEPTIYARTKILKTPTAEEKRRGIHAITLDDTRWEHCNIKAITLLANVLARREAAEAGAQEAILIRDGLATEGAASNLFIVRNKLLMTPPKSNSLLPGITREIVLELAKQHGVPYAEANISVEDLHSADEIWMSSSTKEILPVLKLNGLNVGKGVAGETWEEMNALYESCKERLREGGDI
ncbi:MAG TPA: D-amino acid aminotransferase [Gammaproteobacteria bacterium]|nr:D-amino acid aminotransferase [Gammaproteobacteria bacterium]